MKSIGRFPLAACLGVLAVGVFSAPAGATIINGDFEALLASWEIIPVGPGASVGTVGAYGGYTSTIAHLHAETTYTWDGSTWTGDLSQATLQQGFYTPYSITLGAGETALRFDAAAEVRGEGALDPTVTVMAAGPGGGSAAVTSPTWSAYQFDLTGGPLTPGTPINVALSVKTSPPASGGDYDGEQITQGVDLYIDNIQNVGVGVIPEPCSAAATAMLVVGWAAAVLRRRRTARAPADA